MRAALALIILTACLLAAGSWRVYSNTWDEPEHLAAGLELLDRGQYEYDTEHPPLARVLLALGPWLAGAHSFATPPPEGTQEGIDILYSGGHYWRYLTLARLGTLPFLALLLLAAWLWARRLFASPLAALLTVLLLAAVPPVLGNGALASLDVAAAATILLALYALQRWMVTVRLTDAVIFGLAAGVAVATKFSAVPFIGVSLLLLTAVRAAVAGARPAPGAPLAAPPPAARTGACGWSGLPLQRWRRSCRCTWFTGRACRIRPASLCASTGRSRTCCSGRAWTISSACCSRSCGCRVSSRIWSTASWRSRRTTTAGTSRTCWARCA